MKYEMMGFLFNRVYSCCAMQATLQPTSTTGPSCHSVLTNPISIVIVICLRVLAAALPTSGNLHCFSLTTGAAYLQADLQPP